MVSWLEPSCVHFLDCSYGSEFNCLLDLSSFTWPCWQEGRFCPICFFWYLRSLCIINLNLQFYRIWILTPWQQNASVVVLGILSTTWDYQSKHYNVLIMTVVTNREEKIFIRFLFRGISAYFMGTVHFYSGSLSTSRGTELPHSYCNKWCLFPNAVCTPIECC